MTDSNRPIYLDYHATTPVDTRVASQVLYAMTTAFGNASSTDHEVGDEAESLVKKLLSMSLILFKPRPERLFLPRAQPKVSTWRFKAPSHAFRSLELSPI